MLRGNRKQASPTRRRSRSFQPGGLEMERRILLAIDLANIAGSVTTPTGPGPYGILEAGLQQGGGAGFSVAEVGDVNGDGFDDFVVGAPTINTAGNIPTLGTGAQSQTYLIFGSREVTLGTVNWAFLAPNDRIGSLDQLGNAQQNNPISGTPGFAFDGITFVAGQSLNSQLGASVAGIGDINGDGFADFMIGAPGASDFLGANPGTGRAYLIYGQANMATALSTTIDLDNLGNNSVTVVTFGSTNAPNARIGRAVSSAGDLITDGVRDVAIGAPNATVTGLANQGATYVLSGRVVNTFRSQTIDVNQIGQVGGFAGVVLAGASIGDASGFSLAPAGNFSGAIVNGIAPGDLLIGAPAVSPNGAINGVGTATLIYGAANLPALATPTANGTLAIDLSRVGVDVPGATFVGTAVGDATGFKVSTAGDFNNDGISDILIGSPGFLNATGHATLIYGRSINTPTIGPILGVIPLSNIPTTIPYVDFVGGSPGDLAGFGLTATASINADRINDIAIGAPGVNSGAGAVYLIPGQTFLVGLQSLAGTETLPIQGLIISISNPAGQSLLGASLGGNLNVNLLGRTVDADTVGDLIVGAPGLSLTTGRANAGGVFALEGTFLPLPVPVSTAIPVEIGVDQPFGPFIVNATTPADMQIYVFSNSTIQPNFIPLRDIDPTTIVVNGVAFPSATIVADPVDENQDGLQDAIITITPRTQLGLTPAVTTLALTGTTLSTSPLANRQFLGSAPITVQGAAAGGGGLPSVRSAILLGFQNPNAAAPQFGERLLPSQNALPKFTWKPLRPWQAYRQFRPTPFFTARLRAFSHPDTYQSPIAFPPHTYTLKPGVFTRGQFQPGVYRGSIQHTGATVPATRSAYFARLPRFH